MKKIAPYLLLLAVFNVMAGDLSVTEQKLAKQVEKELPYALNQLKKAVNTNSGTMNFAGVKAVGMQFKKAFDDLGFDTTWHEGSAFNRAGHLEASIGVNRSSRKLLLIGHLDTVFAKTDAFQSYNDLGNGFVTGPGITDMKGGDVVIIAALKALKAQGLLDKLSIKVIMTGDEEKSGRPLSLSKKALIDAGKWADIALGFEDGDSNIKTAVIARRGSFGWSLKVTGKPAHSSQIFRKDIGDGAIYETARILNEFREQLAKEPNLTFNPGVMLAGTTASFDKSRSTGHAFGKSNVIAKTSIVKGDIRAISPQQAEQTKRVMQGIVAQNLPHTSAKIRFSEGYPPMAPTQGNRDLLALYSKVSEDLGYGKVVAVDPRKAGAADISFVAEHVDMALDGLGLMGDGGHTKDEVADLSSFKKNIQKAAILMLRLSHK